MEIFRDASGFVGQWIADRGGVIIPDGAMAYGFMNKEGDLVAGLAFHDFKGDVGAVTIYAESPRWCTREHLAEMFGYVYDKMNMKYLYVTTPSKNERALKLANGVGFKKDGVLRKCGVDGDDLILSGMLREDCPFLDPEDRRYGKAKA